MSSSLVHAKSRRFTNIARGQAPSQGKSSVSLVQKRHEETEDLSNLLSKHAQSTDIASKADEEHGDSKSVLFKLRATSVAVLSSLSAHQLVSDKLFMFISLISMLQVRCGGLGTCCGVFLSLLVP